MSPSQQLSLDCLDRVQPLPAGQQRKWENWEMTFYVVAAATVLMAIAGASREDTNPRHWAKDEAAERMRRREVCAECLAFLTCLVAFAASGRAQSLLRPI